MFNPAERWLIEQLRFDRVERGAFPAALDWSAMLWAARQHGLASIFLKRCGDMPELPPTARAALEIEHYQTLVGNAPHWKALTDWLDRLDAKRIPSLVLKGAALAATVYLEEALRPMTDIDLLVQPADVERVGEIAHDLGYAPAHDRVNPSRSISTQVVWTRASPLRAALDLHWHLIDAGYYARHVPMAWFWDHTTAAHFKNKTMRVFTPTAQLLYLAAHLEMHHAGEGLLRLYDIAALMHKFGAAIAWDELVEAAEKFEWVHATRRTLRRVQALFGVSVPAAITKRLADLPDSPHERLALILARHEAHPAVFLFDGWAQAGWRAKIDFWRQALWPAEEFMAERHAARGGRALLFQRLVRLRRGVRRIPRALLAGCSMLLQQTQNEEG